MLKPKIVAFIMILIGSASASECPRNWSEWFDSNKTKFKNNEISDLYNAFKSGCPRFLEELNKIQTASQTKRQADSLIKVKRDASTKFWSKWHNENKSKYTQQLLSEYSRIFSEMTLLYEDTVDTNRFISLIREKDSIRHVDSINAIIETKKKEEFFKKHRAAIKQHTKHEIDKFGEYDYYVYKGIYSGKGYRIDLIIDSPDDKTSTAHFFTTKITPPACFDDDARLVFLLTNNEKLELPAASRFNCESYMNSEQFTQEQFSAPVKAIRIDHGTSAKGLTDLNITEKQGSLQHIILKNIEWVQELVYTNKHNHVAD